MDDSPLAASSPVIGTDFAHSKEWTEAKPVGWSDYIAKLFADQL